MAIHSKGIPTKESIWFPAFDSKKWPALEARWDIEDIVERIFPDKYYNVYNKVAVSFFRFLLNNPKGVFGQEIASWVKENKFSKSTFYNRVLPVLRDFGLVKRERIGRKMLLKPSTSFSTYLEKISKEWKEIVGSARAKSNK